jgi:hypothetical protein
MSLAPVGVLQRVSAERRVCATAVNGRDELTKIKSDQKPAGRQPSSVAGVARSQAGGERRVVRTTQLAFVLFLPLALDCF